MTETIFHHPLFREFILPFLFIFVVVFAILQKTKILGGDKKQLDAIVAFVIGIIFVSVVYPKEIFNNMILFLTVAIVVVFVALLLWGFITGEEGKFPFQDNKAVKWGIIIFVILIVLVALIWAMGLDSTALDFLFKQEWSGNFWINAIFLVVVAAAIALVVKKGK